MSVVSVAWLPTPPLLIPEIAAGSGDVDATLRAACVAAVVKALAAGPSQVLVMADADGAPSYDEQTPISWHGFGVGNKPAGESLPWQFGIGAWLLDQAGWHGPRRFVRPTQDVGVDAGTTVLVMADGSARRTEKAPGHFDSRAADWDAQLTQLVTAADPDGMAALEQELGVELLSTAATVWPTAAKVVTGNWQTEVLFDAAPHGVGYLAAVWSATA